MSWEVVIGLEIHAQLATRSKIFSGASTAYGAAPNSQACAVDLGLPGVLPVLNKQAVEMAVRFGLAIDAEIGRQLPDAGHLLPRRPVPGDDASGELRDELSPDRGRVVELHGTPVPCCCIRYLIQ